MNPQTDAPLATNPLLWFVEMMELSPRGVIVCTIGTVLCLFGANGNTLTWKKSAMVLLAGFGLGGYIPTVLTNWLCCLPWHRSLISIINLFVGFLMSDWLASIKSAAPSATSRGISALVNFVMKFFSAFSSTTTDKPKNNE